MTISLSGRHENDAQVAYSYWSPNDGLTRSASATCDLYQKEDTNTLFLLDYAATRNGWTIVGTEPNPAGAPALDTIAGPDDLSIMTLFRTPVTPERFNFYIVYKNMITGATVRFDPQEGNIP
ncbi:hypothetical protein [uncultured Massilia sp.]|uniref:hypothetical protein n=1 Tax=uncultured Massilia sp. TaxID=169973 RepID=UPI0025EFEFBD|nr:hypothetical protein [uncultured Massilia sp.]